jgi:uncharacterized membrane protein
MMFSTKFVPVQILEVLIGEKILWQILLKKNKRKQTTIREEHKSESVKEKREREREKDQNTVNESVSIGVKCFKISCVLAFHLFSKSPFKRLKEIQQ